ncbi:hypothetical protein J6590_106623, partial [Homalodisca vitripennis]
KSDCKQVVRMFCVDTLGSGDGVWVNRAHQLGRDRSTIIAHIPDDGDLEYIMSQVRTLKGTGFVVHRDFPREIREKRAKLVAVRAEVERRLNELLGHDFSDFLRKLQEEQLRARTRAPGVKGRTESQGRQHQPTSEGDISANNAGCGQ